VISVSAETATCRLVAPQLRSELRSRHATLSPHQSQSVHCRTRLPCCHYRSAESASVAGARNPLGQSYERLGMVEHLRAQASLASREVLPDVEDGRDFAIAERAVWALSEHSAAARRCRLRDGTGCGAPRGT
jgi:hypothetical protein